MAKSTTKKPTKPAKSPGSQAFRSDSKKGEPPVGRGRASRSGRKSA